VGDDIFSCVPVVSAVNLPLRGMEDRMSAPLFRGPDGQLEFRIRFAPYRKTKTMSAPVNDLKSSIQPSSATEEAKAKYRSLCQLVARQPFFKGLSPQQLRTLADSAMEMQFERGHIILEEGSLANRFYLLLEGKVALETELEGRGMIAIQTLGPGDDLGWAWLFPPHYAQFTARALEPVKTIFFYGTRLREECEQDHELGYQLMKRVAGVATQCLRATRHSLMEYIGGKTVSEK
jgi:hypothetical protein